MGTRALEHLAACAVDGDDVAAANVRVPTVSVPFAASILSAPAPETHGRPMPRATTAAWLVIPPRAVRMPFAACMP